jgi:hypothetical protein
MHGVNGSVYFGAVVLASCWMPLLAVASDSSQIKNLLKSLLLILFVCML